jgi:hypothetical protein
MGSYSLCCFKLAGKAGMDHVLDRNWEYPRLIVAVSIDAEFDMNSIVVSGRVSAV